MSETSPVPPRQAVRNVIEGLVGRDVDFSDGEAVHAGGTSVTAVFVTDKLSTSAVAVVDLAAAARLGGALGLIPKGGVDDAIDDKELPATLRDNCYEVLNVLSSVFNVPGAPHVKLYKMYGPGDALPPDVQSLTATLGAREDVRMDISGYGPGLMSIVCQP
ncbi:hypothetical protein ACIB24_07715 [Spongisporangium articulatum]|uniref:Uncharacterized protein n=1 Tax=Spongisporangium articulatum TaxID=3362603 RepID=A0ABW8AKT6_9ACTN